jgi:hypothetical protein
VDGKGILALNNILQGGGKQQQQQLVRPYGSDRPMDMQ